MLPRFYMVTDRGKIYRFKGRSAMHEYMKKCGEVLGKTILCAIIPMIPYALIYLKYCRV